MSLYHRSFDGNNLSSWLQENRVMNNILLEKLDELGANQVEDLADLSVEDIESFQPLLKKLEFIRFKRALGLLQKTTQDMSHHQRDHDAAAAAAAAAVGTRTPMNIVPLHENNHIRPPAIITIDTNTTSGSSTTSGKMSQVDVSNIPNGSKRTVDVIAKEKNYWLEQQQLLLQQVVQQQQQPPLPSSCPEKNCHGTLSAHQGKRKVKALIKLQGPDYRWIVTCSDCSTRWHSCHFLCGYLSKISRPTGSSDIIRHEMGRYNRWQNKITPPCKSNPLYRLLSVEYNKEQVQSRSENKTVVLANVKNPNEIVMKSSDLHKTNTMPQQHHSDEKDEQEMSMTNSFLNDLDCPLANGHVSCPYSQQNEALTSSSPSSHPKRTKVNDQGEYTGSVMNAACHECDEDEIDETCDEIKKLLLGECNRQNDGNDCNNNDDDCSITADCITEGTPAT
jgi:hypothetical protein